MNGKCSIYKPLAPTGKHTTATGQGIGREAGVFRVRVCLLCVRLNGRWGRGMVLCCVHSILIRFEFDIGLFYFGGGFIGLFRYGK